MWLLHIQITERMGGKKKTGSAGHRGWEWGCLPSVTPLMRSGFPDVMKTVLVTSKSLQTMEKTR